MLQYKIKIGQANRKLYLSDSIYGMILRVHHLDEILNHRNSCGLGKHLYSSAFDSRKSSSICS